MSLNKHKIIPLIESYYHTFTPLERTIADFFIHNTEEQDFSSKNISGLLYVSEASLSRFAQKCGFHGYREFIYEYKQTVSYTHLSLGIVCSFARIDTPKNGVPRHTLATIIVVIANPADPNHIISVFVICKDFKI